MADYSQNGETAVITLNNPPVNSLSSAVRSGLASAVQKALDARAIKCIVICGSGNTFSAGADIKEFSSSEIRGTASIVDAGNIIENSRKPVVAAITGTALGGGLEVALFCHYRIGHSSCRVGFPEVQIGILPGAGGTQRLPRLIGVKSSIDIITSGRHVTADEALKLGILDKVVSGDIVNEGIKFALSVRKNKLTDRQLKNKNVDLVDPGIFDAEIAHIKKKYKGYVAPIFCLKAIHAAVELPYLAGMEREQSLVIELLTSGQARALQYAFFAERLTAKWRHPSGASSQTVSPLPVKTVGVIGAGTMGAGIALCFITSGIPVVLVEQDQKFLDKSLKVMENDLKKSIALGKLTAEQVKQAMSTLHPSFTLEDLKEVDLVIEAVFENLALKIEIFAKLDKICKPQTILCTNTSSLDIDMIADSTKRGDKVIGTHFFAPSYVMKLLENVYGESTSPETIATVMALGKRIKKIPILVKTCDAFAANRMLHNYQQEALFLVEEGALPHEVDQALIDFGMPMGTFKVSDLSGIDVGYKIRRERAKRYNTKLTLEMRFFNGERYCSLGDRLCEMGRYGRKTGKGWYNYGDPGGQDAITDPEVNEIIKEHCCSMGIQRRQVSFQEILERMQLVMINEGFKLLEEGIVSRPQDLDVIWLHGFAWPRYLGGPMYHAKQMGLKNVYKKIQDYQRKFPFSMHWQPSLLLKKLSETDLPMDKWTSLINYSSKL